MQNHGIRHPSDVPPEPAQSGKGSRHSQEMEWKYKLLPKVQDFVYPPSLKATNLLRTIWKNFRIATYDYNTSIKTYYEPGSNMDTRVKILMEQIRPKYVPGQPMLHRHPRQYPRAEWDRRNWYGLCYGQDMNAIAALTGPVARILGPIGFQVEEVLVRVRHTATLEMYGFRDHINPTFAKDVPNDPLLLVFKAMWLGDRTSTYVLAPTGPRFGWNWFAKTWDNFAVNQLEQVLRVRPLGTTRQVLDDQAVDEYQIPKHVMKVPDRVIRQRQRRDARLKLRRLLNTLSDRSKLDYLHNVECYDLFGERIERSMRKWSSQWVDNYLKGRNERIKEATKVLARKPWQFKKAFKFIAEQPCKLTQCEVAERNKAVRIDSPVDPNASNAPAAPAGPVAPPVPGDTAADSLKQPKFKIMQKFNRNPFEKRGPRAQGYQLLDGEGPAGPEDRPPLDPAPEQGQQAEEQQTQHVLQSNQPGNFPGFDAYGVTGGILDNTPHPPLLSPGVATPNWRLLEETANAEMLQQQRQGEIGLRAWYLFHADEEERVDLDPRWTKQPPPQAPATAHHPAPANTTAGNAPASAGEGPSRPKPADEDPDAITPAPRPPPKDDAQNQPPQVRMLWTNTRFIHWDKYIRHWYFYEVDDEYRYLAESGRVGPNSITIQTDLLRMPELGFPTAPAPGSGPGPDPALESGPLHKMG